MMFIYINICKKNHNDKNPPKTYKGFTFLINKNEIKPFYYIEFFSKRNTKQIVKNL